MAAVFSQVTTDLGIIIGEEYRQGLQVDDATGTGINLTGYTITAEIRQAVGGVLIETFTTDMTVGAATGRIDLTMTAAETALLTFSKAKYDIKFDDGSNGIHFWVEGNVETKSPITTGP